MRRAIRLLTTSGTARDSRDRSCATGFFEEVLGRFSMKAGLASFAGVLTGSGAGFAVDFAFLRPGSNGSRSELESGALSDMV
ncbi:hypothetical protein NIES2104_03130 [Leptolyngbya sp. NIES-2104]|nr:hypothetical protein NIES2104_03130 [Leptolyngbya sp. NIES-2104]